MAIHIDCPCGRVLEADERDRGAQAQCPACRRILLVDDRRTSSTAIQATTPTKAETTIAAGDPPQTADADLHVPAAPATHNLRWVVVCCLLLAGALLMAGYYMTGALVYTQSDIAQAQARGALTQACRAYFANNGEYPRTLDDLLVRNAAGGPYLEEPDALMDPWGQRWQYDLRGPMNDGAKPDIWTQHPKTGAVIGNWPKNR